MDLSARLPRRSHAIFSVLYNVLLKPLPYTDPEALVGVWLKTAPLHIDPLNMSPSLYFVFRRPVEALRTE